jgi:hypothetical protein
VRAADGIRTSGSGRRESTVTNEQLADARSLKGATLPDGTVQE